MLVDDDYNHNNRQLQEKIMSSNYNPDFNQQKLCKVKHHNRKNVFLRYMTKITWTTPTHKL